MNSFLNRYLHAIYAAIVIVLLVIAWFSGWIMNGWRLGKQVSDQQIIVEQIKSDNRVLSLRFELLGREQKQASAIAEKAQQEAASLRVSVTEKTKQIMALKASTCAAVIESQWGKQ